MEYGLSLILLLASKVFSMESFPGSGSTFVFLENRICVKLQGDLDVFLRWFFVCISVLVLSAFFLVYPPLQICNCTLNYRKGRKTPHCIKTGLCHFENWNRCWLFFLRSQNDVLSLFLDLNTCDLRTLTKMLTSQPQIDWITNCHKSSGGWNSTFMWKVSKYPNKICKSTLQLLISIKYSSPT